MTLRNNLAAILCSQGKFHQAENLWRDCLRIEDTPVANNNLACVLSYLRFDFNQREAKYLAGKALMTNRDPRSSAIYKRNYEEISAGRHAPQNLDISMAKMTLRK